MGNPEVKQKYDWGSVLEGFDPKKDTAYDVMALGALIHRLDPGRIPWPKTTRVDIHAASGAEFNLIANCAAYGLKAAVLTAMADYPIGDMIRWQIAPLGVDILGPTFAHNAWGPNNATVYSGRLGPELKNRVDYNRANEAALLIKPGMFNYERIFRGGVKWVHTGGLYEALGPDAPDMEIEYLRAGKAQGAKASFDLNFRDNLVKSDRRIRIVDGAEFINKGAFDAVYAQPASDIDAILARFRERTKEVVKEVDVMFANTTDITDCLGIPRGTDKDIDVEATKVQHRKVMDTFPNLRVVVTNLRDEYNNIEHIWGAVATIKQRDGSYLQVVSPIKHMGVEDRIGGGDATAGGFVTSIFYGYTPQEAVDNAAQSGKAVASLQGDIAAGIKWRDVTEAGKKVSR